MSFERKHWAATPEEKLDAREARRILEGSGLTLAAAARLAVAGRLAVVRLTLAEVADRFMLALVRRKPRGSTVRWYQNKLAPMLAALGGEMMDSITRAEILAASGQLPVEESTKRSYHRALRAVWRWAREQEPPLAGVDVTEGLPTAAPAQDDKVAGILPLADVAAIVAGAGRHRSALALMLFAGLRPQELWGIDKPPLRWGHVNVAERIIRVPGECAKTRKPRILEGLPPAVWTMLEPGRPQDPVSSVASQALIRVAQRAAGYAEQREGQHRSLRPWPHDATRHSFATYALALTGDPGRVSLWLGHEGKPTLLYNHYRGLATKAEAARYFAIVPPALLPVRASLLGVLKARPKKKRKAG